MSLARLYLILIFIKERRKSWGKTQRGKKKRGGVSVQGIKIEHKEEKHQEVTKGITLLERSADLQWVAFPATFNVFENFLYKTQGQKFA